MLSAPGDAASLPAPHPIARARGTALLASRVARLSPRGVTLRLVASELIFGIEGLSTNRAGVGCGRRFRVPVHLEPPDAWPDHNRTGFLPHTHSHRDESRRSLRVTAVVCCSALWVSPQYGYRA